MLSLQFKYMKAAVVAAATLFVSFAVLAEGSAPSAPAADGDTLRGRVLQEITVRRTKEH